MTYRGEREWSERFTRTHLLPFLHERESELPFTNIEVTQDAPGWLPRELDIVAKADAVAARNGGLCFVAIRCSYSTGVDRRTFTVRYPQEYRAHLAALADPTIVTAQYMIHSYAAGREGALLAVWIGETLRVIGTIEDRRRQSGHPHPPLLAARSDGQEFAHIAGTSVGARRLAPDDHPSLFVPLEVLRA